MTSSTAHDAPDGRQVLVVGAGIVGVCCALYLQRSGFAVTAVDRDGPGEACSSGNGGSLGFASCVPLSLPGIVARAPRLALDRHGPLVVPPASLPRLLPWLLRFAANSTRARTEATADARHGLLSHLYEAFDPLIVEAGAENLIQRDGMLIVYETDKGLAGAAYALDLRRRRGIEVQVLNSAQTRRMEPVLGPNVRHGVFLPQVSQTTNPLRLTQTLARHFQARGGKIVRAEVKGFEFGPSGPNRAITGNGALPFDLVVIAAGAWSRALAADLGSKLPLTSERGYHVMLPDAGVKMRTCVVAAERYISLRDMEAGLRISGISEFAPPDAAPDPTRADRMTALAKGLIPALNVEGRTSWVGPRPSMPDSRPVIGFAPRHRNALFAFGHDHIGLATSAITGKLIAELASGRMPSVDLAPYRPDRFWIG